VNKKWVYLFNQLDQADAYVVIGKAYVVYWVAKALTWRK
jgi:hypothetical protein